MFLPTFSMVMYLLILSSFCEPYVRGPKLRSFLMHGPLEWSLVVRTALEMKSFGKFPEVPVTKIRVSAPVPYKNPTVSYFQHSCCRGPVASPLQPTPTPQPLPSQNQRKTKGQKLKGKVVLALFHTFWHFPHFSHFFRSFSEFFLQDVFLELRGFTTVLAQRDEKIIKKIKKN